jgi:hypothetical protein
MEISYCANRHLDYSIWNIVIPGLAIPAHPAVDLQADAEHPARWQRRMEKPTLDCIL